VNQDRCPILWSCIIHTALCTASEHETNSLFILLIPALPFPYKFLLYTKIIYDSLATGYIIRQLRIMIIIKNKKIKRRRKNERNTDLLRGIRVLYVIGKVPYSTSSTYRMHSYLSGDFSSTSITREIILLTPHNTIYLL